MNIDLFDYKFEEKQIAKYPRTDRGEAKLLAVDVGNFKIEHKKFYEITEFINKGDVVAVNSSYVKKARIFGQRASGGKVEIFITEFPAKIYFPLKLKAILKSHKTIKEGEKIAVNEINAINNANNVSNARNASNASNASGQQVIQCRQAVSKTIEALKNFGGGNYEILIKSKQDYDYIFGKCALIPLPPYIKRASEEADDIYYQTVYADGSAGFSVAAPTAGLHFDDKIISRIKEKGGIFTAVSLNIGLGTFLPVRTADIREHNIHKETYSVPEETANAINNALRTGNKLILTGTSTVRCLESSARSDGSGGACAEIFPCENLDTSLYIYPGYKFKITKNLITNFHQPKSSLYIMICALIGIDKTKAIYEEAINKGYSLFSYGDAMYLYNI